MRKKLLVILLAFGAGYTWASVKPYAVFINGDASTIQPIQDKDTILVPLTLPASQIGEEWSISLQRYDESRRVDVKMTALKRKTRGGEDCYWCTASGNCPQDSPVGSGKNFTGGSEYFCNRTGKCHHCLGTGKL